jgi:hypothetical protein
MQNFITGLWNDIGAPIIGLAGGALFLIIVAFVADHLF